eukprot:TCONS_00027605-protein
MSFTKNMFYVPFDFERDHAGSGLDITNFISMIKIRIKKRNQNISYTLLTVVVMEESVLHVESRVRNNNGATFPRLTSQSMMNGIYREFNGNKGFGFCGLMNIQRGKGNSWSRLYT